jgi:DNA-directed RNA polymerase subunit RPC12/RpoP
MKKYKCPYCDGEVCGHFKKAFAGSLKSAGIKCPHCQKRLTNGVVSAYVNAGIWFLVAVFEILNFLFVVDYSTNFILLLIYGFVLSKLYDAFFGELEPSNRLEY